MSQTSDLFFWDSTVHTYLYVCNMCPEYICEYNTHIYFLGVAFLNNYIYRSELRGALKTLAKEKTSNSRLYIMPCQDHLLPLHYRTLYIYIFPGLIQQQAALQWDDRQMDRFKTFWPISDVLSLVFSLLCSLGRLHIYIPQETNQNPTGLEISQLSLSAPL